MIKATTHRLSFTALQGSTPLLKSALGDSSWYTETGGPYSWQSKVAKRRPELRHAEKTALTCKSFRSLSICITFCSLLLLAAAVVLLRALCLLHGLLDDFFQCGSTTDGVQCLRSVAVSLARCAPHLLMQLKEQTAVAWSDVV